MMTRLATKSPRIIHAAGIVPHTWSVLLRSALFSPMASTIFCSIREKALQSDPAYIDAVYELIAVNIQVPADAASL
jgi:hypothetical protein